MAELDLAYRVRSYSTGTLGRAISNARNHHWVADDAGGEELGAGEFFLSGITACAVNMIERIASEEETLWTGWMSAWRPIATRTPSRARSLSTRTCAYTS